MTLPGLIAIIMLGVFILASPAIVAELVGNEGVFQIVENFLKA